MALLSWEYYSSLFDEVTEKEFQRAELMAEKEVARVIGPIHWAELPADLSGEFYREQLLDCLCKVINHKKQMKGKAGTGVSSASNDGYSESYVLQTPSEAGEELAKNIRAWLAGTGLVRAY